MDITKTSIEKTDIHSDNEFKKNLWF